MIVSHLSAKNWRNFQHVAVDLRERQFIVGANASGKSNLLDVFRFFRDIAKPEGGGSKRPSKIGAGYRRFGAWLHGVTRKSNWRSTLPSPPANRRHGGMLSVYARKREAIAIRISPMNESGRAPNRSLIDPMRKTERIRTDSLRRFLNRSMSTESSALSSASFKRLPICTWFPNSCDLPIPYRAVFSKMTLSAKDFWNAWQKQARKPVALVC